jgi:non-specific serine/threonine protein kinase
MLGTVAEDEGNWDKAVPLFQSALDWAREAGDQPNVALILDHLGIVTWGLGKDDRATAYWDEALAIHHAINDYWGATISLSFLGLIACAHGDLERAQQLLSESLGQRWQMGITYDIPHGIANMATLAVARGDYARAARLFGAADASREKLGYSLKEPERTIYETASAESRKRLGEERFLAAWEAGRVLSAADGVREALAEAAMPAAAKGDGGSDKLTTRERDVLVLLVKGHTDREIADVLYISPRTAQGHVARLFDKLGVNTRTAAVAAALQTGLVDE